MKFYDIYELTKINLIITSDGNVTVGIIGHDIKKVNSVTLFTGIVNHYDWDTLIADVKNDMDKVSYIPRVVPYTNPIMDGTFALVISRNRITVSVFPANIAEAYTHQYIYVTTPDTIKSVRATFKQNFIDWFSGAYKVVDIRDYR